MQTVTLDGCICQCQQAISQVGGIVSTTPKTPLMKGVEIGLVVLIVLLVIIGLIVGFRKLKANDDDDDDNSGGNSYY